MWRIATSVSVCLLAYLRNHMSKLHEIFCINCGRGLVLLWRQCNMLRISGFVDDVLFSHNQTRAVRRDLRPRDVSQREATQGQSFSVSDQCLSAFPPANWHPYPSAVSLAVHSGVWLWRPTIKRHLLIALFSECYWYFCVCLLLSCLGINFCVCLVLFRLCFYCTCIFTVTSLSRHASFVMFYTHNK